MREILPHPGDPHDEALKELASSIGIDVATLGAAAFGSPLAGTIVGGFLSTCRGVFSAYTQTKVNKVFYDYLKLMSNFVGRLHNELDKKATWDYVTSPENVAELVNMGETIVKARDEEKIRAALNHQVNKTLSRGRDNADFRDFVSAFVRDSTGLEIRVLAALPPAGMYVPTREPEVGDAALETIAENLRNELGVKEPGDIALIDGAIGRLGMLSLCKAQTGMGTNRLFPTGRSVLGEEVLKAISDPAP